MSAWRLLIASVFVIAGLSAWKAGSTTGNYWGLVLVLVAAALFSFLEITPKKGTMLAVKQHRLVRLILAFIVIGMGVFWIYLGATEFYQPVVFERRLLRVIVPAVRETVGSLGMAAIFGAIGISFAVHGIKMFHLRN